MVGGYNKGGYLGRHEGPRSYGPQQQPLSRPILEARRDRGYRRVPGLGLFKRRRDQPAGCRLVFQDSFFRSGAVASALLCLARVSFSGEPCRKAFLLPSMGNNHGGCSRAGLLWVFGWKPGLEGVDSWGRARGVLVSCGACHAFLAAVRTMHGRGSVPVPSLFFVGTHWDVAT